MWAKAALKTTSGPSDLRPVSTLSSSSYLSSFRLCFHAAALSAPMSLADAGAVGGWDRPVAVAAGVQEVVEVVDFPAAEAVLAAAEPEENGDEQIKLHPTVG